VVAVGGTAAAAVAVGGTVAAVVAGVETVAAAVGGIRARPCQEAVSGRRLSMGVYVCVCVCVSACMCVDMHDTDLTRRPAPLNPPPYHHTRNPSSGRRAAAAIGSSGGDALLHLQHRARRLHPPAPPAQRPAAGPHTAGTTPTPTPTPTVDRLLLLLLLPVPPRPPPLQRRRQQHIGGHLLLRLLRPCPLVAEGPALVLLRPPAPGHHGPVARGGGAAAPGARDAGAPDVLALGPLALVSGPGGSAGVSAGGVCVSVCVC
jgi:hypothetical protein